MIPGIVGLTSYLTRRRRERAERDRLMTALSSELPRAMLGDLLRVWFEKLDVHEMEGIVHLSATRKGNELHIGVRLVVPFRTEAAA